jgi:hypothetical protein
MWSFSIFYWVAPQHYLAPCTRVLTKPEMICSLTELVHVAQVSHLLGFLYPTWASYKALLTRSTDDDSHVREYLVALPTV